ncbi:TetR/AcrR family transcriptional regulator [Caulobacter soli]|uniref:TetR/AcrR family transcriptional regulator n=1 Tax=Caulobacter soli TaxID=2708539 RepID=UPI0013EA37D1|nr:TetR/AcrR family transcriptional regulator [Caulobacter soli]
MNDTPKPYHHGDLRRVLLQTALDMLGEEQGWQFTLRELARRADVTHAAPYKHFADKAALLAELAVQGFDRLEEALLAAERPEAPPRGAFITRCLAYVRFGASNANLYRLMFSPDARAAKDPRLDTQANASFDALVDLIARGQAAGWLRARDARAQAVACWTQLHGLTLLTADGLLASRLPTSDPTEAALAGLLDGLEDPLGAAKGVAS